MQMRTLPKPSKSTHLSQYVDSLLQSGRNTFTTADALKEMGISKTAFKFASIRLLKKKRLAHPARGFYVIVPTEFQTDGVPPPSHYIDALMKFFQQPYYIGILSAAAFHGAAHQSPMEFQIVTSAPIRKITLGNSRIACVTKNRLERTPTQPMRVWSGDIPVSTPEATAFDLLVYPHKSGYYSNIATVLIELSEVMNAKKLASVAEVFALTPIAQRLGYLLDAYATNKLTKDLHLWVEEQNPRWTPLRPGYKGKKSEKNEKWHIVVNEEVEPDL